MNENSRKVYITAYPYATQYGEIIIPAGVETSDEINEYISEHFGEIEFGNPELDYEGTDFEFSEGEKII